MCIDGQIGGYMCIDGPDMRIYVYTRARYVETALERYPASDPAVLRRLEQSRSDICQVTIIFKIFHEILVSLFSMHVHVHFFSMDVSYTDLVFLYAVTQLVLLGLNWIRFGYNWTHSDSLVFTWTHLIPAIWPSGLGSAGLGLAWLGSAACPGLAWVGLPGLGLARLAWACLGLA